jgi:uncharacterized protein YegL
MSENESGNLYYHVLLDSSGSMSRNVKEVIEEINSKIDILKADSSSTTKKCTASIWSFNTHVTRLRDCLFIEEVPSITPEEYFASGMTALWDAVGHGLRSFHASISSTYKQGVDQAVFIVFTDGQENSSREFTYSSIHTLIAEFKAKGIEVIFIGTDIQSYRESKDLEFGVSYYFEESNTKEAFIQMKKALRKSYLQGKKFDLDNE